MKKHWSAQNVIESFFTTLNEPCMRSATTSIVQTADIPVVSERSTGISKSGFGNSYVPPPNKAINLTFDRFLPALPLRSVAVKCRLWQR